MRHFENF